MNQPILMHADIDKCPEVSDVGDNAWKPHANTQIGNGIDTLCKREVFKLFAGIPPRLIQFIHDILKGGYPYSIVHVVMQGYLFTQLRIVQQIVYMASKVIRHLLYQLVSFRVHTPCIQWIVGMAYA